MYNLKKILIVGIIMLFVGTIFTSLVGSNSPEDQTRTIDDTEPLDAPSIVIIIDGTMGENQWYVSCVTITIEATDPDITYIIFMVDGGEWITYCGSFVIGEDGYHIIHARGFDSHGNQHNAQAEFKIDQTSPTIWLTDEKIGPNTWLLTADVSDETSGINKVEFYVNDEYVGEVTEPPYEWIYNHTSSNRFSVRGVILNPKNTEETVSFFAVMAIHSVFDKPVAQAIVYDNAGNTGISSPYPPINNNRFGIYLFRQLTFQNSYSGYIGRFFINAVFEDGPW